ncbi:MAG: hypothetical protein ACKOCX_10895 [Planctomycetota bacterium]
MSDAFLCQLDHLAVRDDALFGFGWAVPPRCRVATARLVLDFPDGSSRRVAISIDRAREDVAAAFPHNPHAVNAGFLVLAGWPAAPPRSAAIEFDLTDGGREIVPLALPPTDAPRQPAGVGWSYLLRRGWIHLRQGRLRALLGKLRDFRHRSRAAIATMPESELTTAIRGRSLTLVVDHAMGGGANAHRDRLVADALAGDATVVLLTFVVSSLSLRAEVHEAGRPPRGFAVADLDALAAALAGGRLMRVVYNCGVSFPRPLDLGRFLRDSARRRGVRLEVLIHDYFTVCPAAFLLDDRGSFCGVPDLDRCRACLPKHEDGFVSLAGCTSIDEWRRVWGGLLEAADEIRCFSDSSRRLLTRAYPAVGPRATVVPHDVAPLRRVRRSAPVPGDPLVVGVIGAISHHKGAGVVADLARAIEAAGKPVRIVVIGHLDAPCPREIVSETGAYRPAELPGLVERHGVHLVLLPSICPETFSFVAHETLAMGLPLMTLDLGAPADLARGHPLGRVSPRSDGPGLLAELLAFAADLADQRLGAPA